MRFGKPFGRSLSKPIHPLDRLWANEPSEQQGSKQ